MNGTKPYTLMPENIHNLLPLPTLAQNLRRKRDTIFSEISKAKRKVTLLQNEVSFWNEFSDQLKSEYKKTDLALTKLDGRLKKAKVVKVKTKTKAQIKQFNATQLTNIIAALELTMKEQEEEKY